MDGLSFRRHSFRVAGRSNGVEEQKADEETCGVLHKDV